MSKEVMARFLNKRKAVEIESSSDFVVDVNNLPSDPHDRKAIASYNVNQRDDVIRVYLLRGPCQPTGIKYPQSTFQCKELRKFKKEWYDRKEYKGWLEYSIKSERVFCLCCYLFRSEFGDHRDTFLLNGYNNWKKST
ncbi:putative transcription factor and/or regulators TTF-type(Zn) family [Helianthus annuus]|uniref:Transcription factor and/or regulators TTF-type(Zn) family n=2 Tax=Helianthus annuus TaxID=4232 RepID=A0A9K3HFZ9_HELAN|nr:putative transcription factor and/or regulators TTF-type(Zn) family [Helianthus annuus]KAJ0862389.1 putative transcription factor and/or regulators TTF-type(Zn) family [Helianthus annuus]